MKRGFLFGLGSALFLGVLDGLAEIFWGHGCTLKLDDECQRVGAYVSTAVGAPLSALAIWRALASAPNRSWPHAIWGWLLGFGAFGVLFIVVSIAVGIVVLN